MNDIHLGKEEAQPSLCVNVLLYLKHPEVNQKTPRTKTFSKAEGTKSAVLLVTNNKHAGKQERNAKTNKQIYG